MEAEKLLFCQSGLTAPVLMHNTSIKSNPNAQLSVFLGILWAQHMSSMLNVFSASKCELLFLLYKVFMSSTL